MDISNEILGLVSEIHGSLRARGETLSTAESLTAGGLSYALTIVPGASDVFLGSLTAYRPEIKISHLSVSKSTIAEHSVVSEEVAIEMAIGAKEKLGVDICISTTGIAGPNGGTEDKPVGLVWIAIALKNKTIARKFQFGDNRERNLTMTVAAALNFLRYEFLSLP